MPHTYSYSVFYAPNILHTKSENDIYWKYSDWGKKFLLEMTRLRDDIYIIYKELTGKDLDIFELIQIISKILPETSHGSNEFDNIRALGVCLTKNFITDKHFRPDSISEKDKLIFDFVDIFNEALKMRLTLENKLVEETKEDNIYDNLIKKLESRDQQYQTLEKEKAIKQSQYDLLNETVRQLVQDCQKLKKYLENRGIKNNFLFHKKVKTQDMSDSIIELNKENRTPTYDRLLYNSVCELINILNGTDEPYLRIERFQEILLHHKHLYNKNYDTILMSILKGFSYGVVTTLSTPSFLLGDDHNEFSKDAPQYQCFYKQSGLLFYQKANHDIDTMHLQLTKNGSV